MKTGKKKPLSSTRASADEDSVLKRHGVKTVSHDEIIEERIAYQKALRAFECWAERHNAIRDMLVRGAIVEKGIYRVELRTENVRAEGFEFPCQIEKLVIS